MLLQSLHASTLLDCVNGWYLSNDVAQTIKSALVQVGLKLRRSTQAQDVIDFSRSLLEFCSFHGLPDQGGGLNLELGILLTDAEKYEDAKAAIERALSLAETSTDKVDSLRALVTVLVCQGDIDEALRMAEDCKGVAADSTVCDQDRAKAFRALALVYLSKGRLEDAKQCYQEDMRKCNQDWQDRPLLGLAEVSALNGDFDESLAYLTRALALTSKLGAEHRWLEVMAAIARTLVWSGRSKVARSVLLADDKVSQRYPSILAFITALEGRFSDALAMLENVNPGSPNTNVSVARVYINANCPSRAIRWLELGTPPKTSLLYMEHQIELGVAYSMSSRHEEADECFGNAEEFLKFLPVSNILRGKLYENICSHLLRAERINELLERISRKPTNSQAYFELEGMALVAQKQYGAAVEQFLSIREPRWTAKIRAYYALCLLRLHEQHLKLGKETQGLVQPEDILKHAKRAVDDLEQKQSKTNEDALRILHLDAHSICHEVLIEVLTNIYSESNGSLSELERLRGQSLRVALTNKFSLEINTSYQEIARECDCTFVSFHSITDKIFAWIVTPDGIRHMRFEMPLRTLRRLRELFSQNIKRRKQYEVEAQQLLDELHSVLWIPLQVRPPHVVLIPDAALAGVPFAALRDKTTKRYVVDDYALSYSPSISLYRILQHRAEELERKSRNLTPSSIIFYDSELVHTKDERSNLKSALHGNKCEVDATSITAAEALEILSNANYAVVFAMHGEHDQDPPTDPHALAELERTWLPLSDCLFPSQIASHYVGSKSLNFRITFFNCCWLAGGGSSKSEVTYGFPRAMLLSGVPTVVAARNVIDDTSAAKFSPLFFNQCKKGKTHAEALRQAMLGVKDEISVFDWAAYIIYGFAGGKTSFDQLN